MASPDRLAALLAALSLAACTAWPGGTATAQQPATNLAGTAWQLVSVQMGDGKALRPEGKADFTLAFNAESRVAVRVACNRGGGTWQSAGAGQLQFGPIALTKVLCPANPVDDRFRKDLEFIRSYVLKDGRLYLSLMADGGIYEFEPLTR